jgi:proline-specific peptidase
MERFAAADGRTLAYRRTGEGPVLVCHPGGPGFSSHEFADFAGLGDSLTLVLFDPRGTGGSDPPADRTGYALSDFVADLEELRGHLGLARLSLLGFSHGGMVAMAYASTHPGRVERLVLASTLARVGEAQEAEAAREIERRAGEPWHADAVEALQAEEEMRYESADDLARLLAAMAPMYFTRWDDRARGFVAKTSDVGNADALKLFNADVPDLLPELPRITAPTLVVAGADDFICGPASAREIVDAVPDARLAVIPDAGHFTYFEQPEAFRAALLPFLASG